jgi:DNA polymerase III alpha subunit
MIDFDTIDLNCAKTWELIGEGNTKGVFQLESRLGQSMSKKLKPENLTQLAGLISILRPGCISGDTKVFVNKYKHSDGRMRFTRIKIRDIANNPKKFETLISYDEQTGKLVSNKMINAFYTGNKECFRVVIRSNERENSNYGNKDYKLECTADHKLLTPDGWKKLEDIKINERVLVSQRKGTKHPGFGNKSFRQRCYNTYIEKCIFCDWNNGSLDVNHINGNRYTNNHHDNLCYMCPNHHREFTEGKISIDEVNKAKAKHLLPKTIDGKWCKLVDKISVGVKDVYDISMTSPHHNFIAGGIIVHNCLEAIRDGKSVSNHYIDKKNNNESVDYFHFALEDILKETFGEMVYQEQAMQICQKVANFNLSEADMIRKAIGKKNVEEMSKLKELFLSKSREANIVTVEEAELIFSWIEKSQRYSFNKSHAVCYALNAYVAAYAKAHYPLQFFTSYLTFAKDKIDPMKETKELVNNAIETGIKIYRPDFRNLNHTFTIIDNIIYFGLTNIKGVGESVYKKLINIIETNKLDYKNLNVNELLFQILNKINSSAAKNMIMVGAFSYLKLSRKSLLFYLDIIGQLSKREIDIAINECDMNKSLQEILTYIMPKTNKRRQGSIWSLIETLDKPPYTLQDDYEWIATNERLLLGNSITCSVIDGRDTEDANCDCSRLIKDRLLPKRIVIGAEVSDISVIKTKNGKNPGQDMAFIKLSDSTGSVDIIAFPKEYEDIKNLLRVGNTLMFILEQSKNKDCFFTKKCWQI